MIHICLVAIIFIVKGVSFINSQSLKIGGKIIFSSEFMPLGKDGFQIENLSTVTQYGQHRPFHMTPNTETSLFRSLLSLLKPDSKLKTVLSTIIQTPLLCGVGEHLIACPFGVRRSDYCAFSYDVTAAILASQNNPVGVELFSYTNAFFYCNRNFHSCWSYE